MTTAREKLGRKPMLPNTTSDSTPLAFGSTAELGPGSEAKQCPECHGKGWNDVWRKVTGHYMGGEVFRQECEHCEGAGQLKEELQA